MRIELDDLGYVRCVLYGCSTGSCVEYTGLVPTEPEEYTDIDDWANRACIQMYYLDSNGNLAYNDGKYIEQEETLPWLSDEQLAQLGITSAIQAKIDAMLNTIYPVGSIYISVDANFDPSVSFGGTWEKIEDRFLLAAGTTYQGGSEGGSETHSHYSPVGYNSSNKLFGITYANGSRTGSINGTVATTGSDVVTSSGTYSFTLPKTTSDSNLPPYVAVYVWKKTSESSGGDDPWDD